MLNTDLVAILPLRAAAAEIERGELVALSGDWSFEHRIVGLFTREDQKAHQAVKTLATALEALPA